MRLRFVASSNAPNYAIDGEVINGVDLSPLEHGGKFLGNAATRDAGIRDAHRDADGVLHVTLEQRVIASQLPGRKAHWRASPEIDADDYDSGSYYVVPTGVDDLSEGVDYMVAWAQGCAAGEKGWTIKPLSEEA